MKHLRINKTEAACENQDDDLLLVGPEDYDDIDCDGCKETVFYPAAERIVYQMHHDSEDYLGKLLEGRTRIDGPLGDRSVIQEGMTARERVQATSAVMSPENKTEWLHRIHDMTSDTCFCGGSILHNEHSDDCRGPDPEKWKLSPEETNAELRVMGIDPVASAARMKVMLDKFQAAAIARVEAKGGPS